MAGEEEVLLCARYGELEDLQTLIDAGENVNAQDAHGNTALHMAAGNGHIGVVEFLLPRMLQGAVDQPNEGGNTPLHWAALNGHTVVVQKLLDFGANPQPVNKAKRTPLDEAVLREHHPTAECIVKSPRYNPEIDAGPEPEPNAVEEEAVVDGEGTAGAEGAGSVAAAGTASSAAAASDAAAATAP